MRGGFSLGCHNKINVHEGELRNQLLGQAVFLDLFLSSSLTWQNGIIFHLSEKEWDRLLLSIGCSKEFRSGYIPQTGAFFK